MLSAFGFYEKGGGNYPCECSHVGFSIFAATYFYDLLFMMKLALLPRNIGSEMNYRVQAMRKVGVDARAYSFQQGAIISNEHIESLPKVVSEFNPWKRLRNILEYRRQLKDILDWADVVHWVYDLTYLPFTDLSLEFDLLRSSGKPGVIQWAGSDIRVSALDAEHNLYFREACERGEWKYKETLAHSLRNQSHFAKLQFAPLEFIGMGHYIRRDWFDKIYRVYQMLGVQDYVPVYPDPSQTRPIILHSPSHQGSKGSRFVRDAVEQLKGEFDFEFQLIENVNRAEALKMMQRCDIYVDQLILGCHGGAAIEAMGFGKPVLCYIHPVIGKDYPVDLPIVNANPDTVAECLRQLLQDPHLRHEKGKAGRAYVEAYHDDVKNAELMKGIYGDVVERHSKGR